MGRVIKVHIEANHKAQGTCYKHKISNDYGVPTMRENKLHSKENPDLRGGLSKPKLAERREKEAMKFNPNKTVYAKKSLHRPKAWCKVDKCWKEL